MRFTQGSIFAKALFAVVTLVSFLPAPAMAQQAAGKFTLKHPVRWGSVTLPAGDYSYKLEHQVSAMLVVRPADWSAGFLMMAQSVSTADANQEEKLVLQRNGGEWFVSSITLSSIGETLYFAAPTPHPELARASTHDKLASNSKP